MRSIAATSRAKEHPRWFVLEALGWNYRDAIGAGLGVVAVVAIVINGVFLQTGSHPAPMFTGSALPAAAAAPAAAAPPTAPAATAALPRGRPPETVTATAPAAARPSTEIIADIQRELTRLGHYDAAIDGRYGPRTDSAVRDFERASGLKPSAEPNEALLQAMKRTSSKTARSGSAGRVTAQPVRHDPFAQILAPSRRVLAMQRALSDFGYGQLKPTGIVDNETRAAIEKFERERKLPVTGQVSDRVARELAGITGRPLE